MRFVLITLLALSACGRTELVHGVPISPSLDSGVVTTVDSGVIDAGTADAGVTRCLSSPFGVDCCRNGQRVTSAFCLDGIAVCSTGDICTCNGVDQSFMCVDFCGTDAFASPECVNGAWQCARNLMRTTDCPIDTCWGEPGDCCKQPRCEGGEWKCAAIEC